MKLVNLFKLSQCILVYLSLALRTEKTNGHRIHLHSLCQVSLVVKYKLFVIIGPYNQVHVYTNSKGLNSYMS